MCPDDRPITDVTIPVMTPLPTVLKLPLLLASFPCACWLCRHVNMSPLLMDGNAYFTVLLVAETSSSNFMYSCTDQQAGSVGRDLRQHCTARSLTAEAFQQYFSPAPCTQLPSLVDFWLNRQLHDCADGQSTVRPATITAKQVIAKQRLIAPVAVPTCDH